ncbi:DUF4113 domain-containing protein [Shewanella zhangzhouensis]|uniref:DUF4113 domain-containing protein n=1 Tax=Shewanella zhangzhouensis TaxID=2864213 RepID=UPI0033131E42
MLVFANKSPYDESPVGFKRLIKFAVPTNCSAVITTEVSRVVPELYRPGVRYYKIGVGLLDLTDEAHFQADLFTPNPANPRIMQACDALNHRYGSDTLFLAAQGIEQKWAMRRELLLHSTPPIGITFALYGVPDSHCHLPYKSGRR